jgi:ferredoxin/flavodoxin
MLAGVALCAPGCMGLVSEAKAKPEPSLKTQAPTRALVAWYSPTGNTRRYARLAGKCLEKAGLAVDVLEYRDVSADKLRDYELILVGSPVYNWDIPENIRKWLQGIPAVPGTAVGAFVSFGGPEGNQQNAACSILELLEAKQGAPVGRGEFMNIGTFPTPHWDYKGQREHSHLPDQHTFDAVRRFAADCVENTQNGLILKVRRRLTARDILTWLPVVALGKLFIDKHEINASTCIRCGTCAKLCPAGAIGPEKTVVDRRKCLLCFACFNNCPTQAVTMRLNKQELYNYPEFLRRNNITPMEPEELLS